MCWFDKEYFPFWKEIFQQWCSTINLHIKVWTSFSYISIIAIIYHSTFQGNNFNKQWFLLTIVTQLHSSTKENQILLQPLPYVLCREICSRWNRAIFKVCICVFPAYNCANAPKGFHCILKYVGMPLVGKFAPSVPFTLCLSFDSDILNTNKMYRIAPLFCAECTWHLHDILEETVHS